MENWSRGKAKACAALIYEQRKTLVIFDNTEQQLDLGIIPCFYKILFKKWKKFNLYNKLGCMLKTTYREMRKNALMNTRMQSRHFERN